MKNPKKVLEEKNGKEKTLEKRPYKTPRLERLGECKRDYEGNPHSPHNGPRRVLSLSRDVEF